jgi:FAD/FMN-containing dehydrogenase
VDLPRQRRRDVIRVLDPIRFSPAVRQSNHDFSVGGTLSVNAHGWPVQFGPFGSTLQRFRIMLADGSVLTCSSTENAELQIDRTLARTDPQLQFRNALWDIYLA